MWGLQCTQLVLGRFVVLGISRAAFAAAPAADAERRFRSVKVCEDVGKVT